MKRRNVVNSEIEWIKDHENELDDKFDQFIIKMKVEGFPASHPLSVAWKIRQNEKAMKVQLSAAEIFEAYGFDPNE